jgi:flagellar basal body-associated protein FliL
MRKREKSNKIILIVPVLLMVTILIVGIIITTKKDNEMEQERRRNLLTRTLEVEGKEVKYKLLENKDDTIYGIEFENDDLMTEVIIIRREGKKEIKNEIVDGIYKFTEDAIYKLEIETTTGIRITTDTFEVKCQK